MGEIEAIYAHRFSEEERIAKNAIWQVLCRHFFQRYVRPEDVVLDLGAGFCEFINNIQCRVRYAVDISEETARYARPEVIVYRTPATDLSPIPDGTVDLVFCSNFFEHLPDKGAMSQTLREIHRVLVPGGRLMILQPNIKYLYKEYWDFFDHHIPLSHLSMVEALAGHGFVPRQVIPRFMPFTSKSALPKGPFFVRLYLMFPPAWRILGRQMFILAEKGGPAA
jgi:SAM-dependent methyltransferase